MAKSRRDFLRLGMGAAAGLVASHAAAQHEGHQHPSPPPAKAPAPAPAPAVRTSRKSASPRPYVPVEVPDVPKLPWRLENFKNPLNLGLALIWSGNAAVFALAVALGWRLHRQ